MADAEQVFFNSPLLVLPDPKHSEVEPRFHALGKTNEGRRLHISFTLRGGGQFIRVISARDMHRKERVIYRSEEHTSELQSRLHLVCRLLLEKKKNNRLTL